MNFIHFSQFRCNLFDWERFTCTIVWFIVPSAYHTNTYIRLIAQSFTRYEGKEPVSSQTLLRWVNQNKNFFVHLTTNYKNTHTSDNTTSSIIQLDHNPTNTTWYYYSIRLSANIVDTGERKNDGLPYQGSVCGVAYLLFPPKPLINVKEYMISA